MHNNPNLSNYLLGDIMAFGILSPLIEGGRYLPFTGAALRPFCISHILNDIVINNRAEIVEFGSGISTIFIARLIKRNNLKARILSVEHDKEWYNMLGSLLYEEGLEGIVHQVHAPLGRCSISENGCEWYDTGPVSKAVESRVVDMVIIDGPPAWKPDICLSRYPALPFMWDKLGDRFSIFLDDACRPGEQEIIMSWEKQFGLNFTVSNQSLAYATKGPSGFTEPFSYY